eukprot:6704682-Heterocapsa_arctica.AAC.1
MPLYETAFNFDARMGDTSDFFEGFLDEARCFVSRLLVEFGACARAACFYDEFYETRIFSDLLSGSEMSESEPDEG